MKTRSIYLLLFLFCLYIQNIEASYQTSPKASEEIKKWEIFSPDKNIQIVVSFDTDLSYTVFCNNIVAVKSSAMGVVLDKQDIGKNARFTTATPIREIKETYEVKTGKQLIRTNHCNEQILSFLSEENIPFTITLRTYNDGIAFRYGFPKTDNKIHRIDKELTEFVIPSSGKVWGYPYGGTQNKKGIFKNNYEGWPIPDQTIYPKGKTRNWAYPVLFETNGLWIMLTEAYLDGNYPATHLQNDSDNSCYRIAFPNPQENIYTSDSTPIASLPWETPWRVVVASSKLSDVFATTIQTHLNPPTTQKDLSWIKPGGSVWSWWAGRRPDNYNREIEFIHYAKEMNWKYSLLDEGWQGLGNRFEELVQYAAQHNIGIWLWYKSNTGQESNPNANERIMCDSILRRAEMERISKLGIKGIKVDFFDTDKQPAIKLYTEILKDAAQYHLMVNFHGCTVPRGWERTYPHLMTMEAVKGSEAMAQNKHCDAAPAHHTTIALTRNIVGSVDYTPLMLTSKNRKDPTIGIPSTTRTHQVALSVIFETGFLCYAEGPQTVLKEPEPVKAFLRQVPYAWDESILLSGYPEDHVCIARRYENKWYIAAINGNNFPKEITIQLPDKCQGKKISAITDGDTKMTYSYETIEKTNKCITIKMKPFGGYVGVISIK